MKIGFIGTGNMGRILVEALIDAKAISPSSVIITNRTKSKAMLLKDKYKEIKVVDNAVEVAAGSNLLFICVKPLDVYQILEKIKPHLAAEKCIISITSPISTSQIEKKVSCSTVRVIPS